MKKIKLAILFGGKTSEYPVSLHSAGSLIQNINKDRYDLVFIGIDPNGKWYTYNGDVAGIEQDTWQTHESCTPCVLSSNEAYKGILNLQEDHRFEVVPVDCFFPIIHGKNGEDGTLQGLFELSGIPYVGCGHMSSSICMDKELTHIVLEHANLVCSPYICVYKQDVKEYANIFETAKEKLGLPIFIKPANAGSSFGISKIESFDGFEAAMETAFFYDGKGKVLLEAAIEGFEVGCAIMGNDDLFVGSVDEIEISAPFFDYEGKYEMRDSHIYCPARISMKLYEEARCIARKAYQAMNCKGLTRVDMFITTQNNIVINELNTIPGFTDTSRYPTMMKEAGISFTKLIDTLVDFALEKENSK